MNKKEALIAALNGERIWSDDEWFAFEYGKFAWSDDLIVNIHSLPEDCFSIYKEKPKLIDWYRPAIIWKPAWKSPGLADDPTFLKKKNDITAWDYPHGTLVMEWETRQYHATYEDCKEMQDGNN